MSTDVELLEKFICDNKDLQKLEKMFEKFNMFDCLKLSRQEIRHSNFLAWLIDPNETHGLGDYFLKNFLKNILADNKDSIKKINGINFVFDSQNTSDKKIEETYNIPSVFDIDCWDMTDVEVFREQEHIDLLIIDETNKFVFVIENKIDTNQHSNQLERYREYVDSRYSSLEYKKLFIYLKPKDNEKIPEPYIYVGYSSVFNAIDILLENKMDKISAEINMAISHYKNIIERDIMQEDEIRKICRKIYKQHKKAIDLIKLYSDTKRDLFEILKNIIEADESLILEDSKPEWIRFIPKEVDFKSLKFAKQDWIKSDRILIFEIHNAQNCIDLDIVIRNIKGKEKENEKSKLLDLSKYMFRYQDDGKDEYKHIKSKTLLSSKEYYDLIIKDSTEIQTYLAEAINKSGLINDFIKLAKKYDKIDSEVICQG